MTLTLETAVQTGLITQGQTIWQSTNPYDVYIRGAYGAALAEIGPYSAAGLYAYGYLNLQPYHAPVAPTSSPVIALAPAPASPPVPPHLQFSASPIGTPIFLMLGNCRLPGQIIWADGIDASNTVLDTSYLTFAACYGEPIDPTASVTLDSLYANGTKFWSNEAGAINPGNITNDQFIALQASVASMRVYHGRETELPDPTMEAALGVGLVPANRGLRYIVFQDFPIIIAGNSVPNITAQWTIASNPTVADAMDKLITHVHTRSDTRRACSPSIDLGGADPGCHGLVITTQDTVLSHLQSHKTIFGYQIQEGNPVKVVRRAVDGGLVIDKSVTEADLVAQSGSAAINLQRVNPTRLPFGLDLQYMDSDYSFDNKTAQARHNASRVSNTVTSCYSSYSFNANTARTLSYDILYKLRSEALTGTIELDDMAVEVSDIINVTTNEGDVHTVLVQQQTNTKTRSNQLAVLGLLSSQGADVAGDGGDWFASTGKLNWPEDVWTLRFDVDSASNKIWCFGEQDGFHLTFAWNYLTAPLRKLSKTKWRDLGTDDASAHDYVTATDWGGQETGGGFFSGFAQILHDDFYFYLIQDSSLVISRIPKTAASIDDRETLVWPQGYYVDWSGTNDNINYSQGGSFAALKSGKLYIPYNGRYNGVGGSHDLDSVMKLVVIDLNLWSLSGIQAYDYRAVDGVTTADYATGIWVGDSGVVTISTTRNGGTVGKYYHANLSDLTTWTAVAATFPSEIWKTAGHGDYFYVQERTGSAVSGRKTRVAVISTSSGGWSETVIDLNTQDSNYIGHQQLSGTAPLWCSDTHLFIAGNHTNFLSSGADYSPENRYIGRFAHGTLTADSGRFLGEIWYNENDHYIESGKYDNGRCYINLASFRGRGSFIYIDESFDPATVVWYGPRPADMAIPTNNYFATPYLLEVDKPVSADLSFCNTEVGEPFPHNISFYSPDSEAYYRAQAIVANNGHSCWFRFAPPLAGSPTSTNYTITISSLWTSISLINFGLDVYTGDSLAALVPVASRSQLRFGADDTALPTNQVSFDAVAGTEYKISATWFSEADFFGGAIFRKYAGTNGSVSDEFLGVFNITITQT